MSGLRKAKKYDWKDSNMALFGSDTEKAVKKESAESEPAWQGSGQAPGLKIWRIVKFQVTEWPEEEYGSFYEGDSYIILNTYKEEDSDALLYDVHFWIGKYSTQDEYGTAAYKTVELDTFHDDKPVQHREVQGHESSLFRSYFENITLLKGGADTGFNRVLPEEYTPRLMQVKKGGNNVVVTEIPKKKSNVTEEDVFILDLGETIYQYNGSNCQAMEKFKASSYSAGMKSGRKNPQLEVLEGAEVRDSHPFWKSFPDEDEVDGDDDGDDDGVDEKKLLRVDVESHEAVVVKEGEYCKDDLKSDDVFIVDTGNDVFVWVGKEASVEERKNGMSIAHIYMQGVNAPWRSVTVIGEGQKSAHFETAIAA